MCQTIFASSSSSFSYFIYSLALGWYSCWMQEFLINQETKTQTN